MWNTKGDNNFGGFLLLGQQYLWNILFLFCFILPEKIKKNSDPNFIYSIYIQVGKTESAYSDYVQ